MTHVLSIDQSTSATKALIFSAAGELLAKTSKVISTLNNPWFVVLGETARDRAIELGYEATLFDSQNDTSKEAAHFDNEE